MDKLSFAKKLKRDQTETERRMWFLLRGRRFHEIKFRIQQPMGKYIVDFVCFDQKLIIELDGSQHGLPENIEKTK
jgi:very-short-patch-repair endonuclease